MQQEKQGLNNTTIALMVSVALFYDALQWLLGWIFMGWLVSIFAGLTFYTWFKVRGMSFMKPKRLAAFGGSFIVEMIPVVGDILPTWTASIVYLALDSKVKKAISHVPGGEIVSRTITKASDTKTSNKNEGARSKPTLVKPREPAPSTASQSKNLRSFDSLAKPQSRRSELEDLDKTA